MQIPIQYLIFGKKVSIAPMVRDEMIRRIQSAKIRGAEDTILDDQIWLMGKAILDFCPVHILRIPRRSSKRVCLSIGKAGMRIRG